MKRLSTVGKKMRVRACFVFLQRTLIDILIGVSEAEHSLNKEFYKDSVLKIHPNKMRYKRDYNHRPMLIYSDTE